ILIIAGLVMVVFGAPVLLSGAVSIAEIFSIPSAVIGLTMVAVGTSLPELTTSVVAAIRKSHGVAVGNLLGSNIFNLLFIIGLNALVFSIPAPAMRDMLVMIGFSLAVFPLFVSNTRFARFWGCLLLGAYLVYVLLLYGVI
ncbi:MAG TPA: sodium:calcium antiporter, partial [bacterium]|nr:sodium:calcium antiporter [bacterium]